MEHFTETTNYYNILFLELKKLGVKVPKTKKIMSSIPRQENCDLEPENKVFGVSLAKQEWSCDSDGPLPKFLASATTYLLKNSKVVGLFRLAGSIARQRNLRMRLEKGANVDGSEPNDVASLLKQWLRELPEPLIPRSMHDLFIRCYHLENKEKRLAAILLACLLLPPENLYALKHLLCFLQKFAADSYQNKMGPQNLALIMAPNIFVPTPGSIDKSCKGLVHIQSSVIELLIENCEKIGEILPSMPLHTSIHDGPDIDSSSDILGIETFKSSRRRRNGSVYDLFSGIKKLVAQNAILPKIQEKRVQLIPRKEIILDDGGNFPDASKSEEKSELIRSDVRKRSFGLLRRKDTKRTKTSLLIDCHQSWDTGAVSTENKKLGSKLSSESEEEINSQPVSKLKSVNISKSDYNARLISKELCKLSIRTSSPPSYFQNLHRCASLQWFPSECSSDFGDKKSVIFRKTPNIPLRKGSLIRGKPNTIKSGLPCQHLKYQNSFRSCTASKSSIDLTNKKQNSLSGINEQSKMNTDVELKRKREKCSLIESSESANHSTSLGVSKPNINQTAVLSFHSINSATENVIQQINPLESSAITESSTKNLNRQPFVEKVAKNSMIPRLRKSVEMKERDCEHKRIKARISDSSDSFRSKIPVKLKKNISTQSLDISLKDKSLRTPPNNFFHSPRSTSLTGDSEFLTCPEINSSNKRESIAMILRNNSGRVKSTVNLYNAYSTPTGRNTLSNGKRRLSYSSRKRLSSSIKVAKALSTRESYTSSEENAHSKNKVKHQRLPLQKVALTDLESPSPIVIQPLKEVTNVHSRYDGVQNVSNIRIKHARKMDKLVPDNYDGNRKCKNLKSNSFTECKANKVPQVISRSASSPGCSKPGSRLFRLVSSRSCRAVTEEIINQQNCYPSKCSFSQPSLSKSGSSLSIEKLKCDVMIDEWECEL